MRGRKGSERPKRSIFPIGKSLVYDGVTRLEGLAMQLPIHRRVIPAQSRQIMLQWAKTSWCKLVLEMFPGLCDKQRPLIWKTRVSYIRYVALPSSPETL